MALSPGVVPRDASDEREAWLTVVTVADVLKNTAGLAKRIGGDDSVSVVSCSGLDQFVKNCAQPKPCVAVADASFLADFTEYAKAADIVCSIRILIVVDEDDPRFAQKLLRMGFAGVIQRSASAAIFRRALDAVAQGELWASRKTISALVRNFLSESRPNKLTSREKEILGLVARGHKNQEIAEALFVSRETVRWHLRGIYSKLRVPDRKRAIEYALAEGLTIAAKPTVGEGMRNTQSRVCS